MNPDQLRLRKCFYIIRKIVITEINVDVSTIHVRIHFSGKGKTNDVSIWDKHYRNFRRVPHFLTAWPIFDYYTDSTNSSFIYQNVNHDFSCVVSIKDCFQAWLKTFSETSKLNIFPTAINEHTHLFGTLIQKNCYLNSVLKYIFSILRKIFILSSLIPTQTLLSQGVNLT